MPATEPRPQDVPYEQRYSERIPFPNPSWLGQQPIQPIELGSFHPIRIDRHTFREFVKITTDGEDDTCAQFSPMAKDPRFLLWLRQAYEQDGGLRARNKVDHGVHVFVRFDVSVVGAGDPNPGERLDEVVFGACSDTWCGAEQKEAPPFANRLRHQGGQDRLIRRDNLPP